MNLMGRTDGCRLFQHLILFSYLRCKGSHFFAFDQGIFNQISLQDKLQVIVFQAYLRLFNIILYYYLEYLGNYHYLCKNTGFRVLYNTTLQKQVRVLVAFF